MARPLSTLDPIADTDDDAGVTPAFVAHLDPLIPTDGNWTRASMKRFLDAQPRRMVNIARDENDRHGQDAYHLVIYQGFRYPILKGKQVPVPEPIALIVDELYVEYRTSQAQNLARFLDDVGDGEGHEIVLPR